MKNIAPKQSIYLSFLICIIDRRIFLIAPVHTALKILARRFPLLPHITVILWYDANIIKDVFSTLFGRVLSKPLWCPPFFGRMFLRSSPNSCNLVEKKLLVWLWRLGSYRNDIFTQKYVFLFKNKFTLYRRLKQHCSNVVITPTLIQSVQRNFLYWENIRIMCENL